ncbi:SlyX family protein [Hydrogenophaga sp.]|uniref:SlyX family protein n=1 Tax=Hydrogenophaga sp. TaxID=1904254 RepID=UPI00286E010E|nr:SlyX family protein [Hydrogenophaga sp.]
MNTSTPAQDTDERLTRLEIQLSYAEDLLDTLNTLVAQQQDQITRLLHDVGQLRRQREDEAPGGFRSLRDELPPHY